MTTPQDRVHLVKSESDRIKQYLSALSPVEWSSQSACEAWQVRDVVAHMIMGGEMYVGNIGRGLANDPSPDGMLPAGSADVAARQVANAQRAISIREYLGEQLLSAFSASCDELDRLLDGIGPQGWDKPCFHPAATIPVRTYVNLRLGELSLHEWDIRSMLDRSAHLPEKSLPAILDAISAFVIGVLFNPGSKLSAPVRYRLELTGAVPSRHDIVVEDGKARMQPTENAIPDVTLRCDTETFVLLAYGRITLAAALADGRIIAEGDRDLADQFAE